MEKKIILVMGLALLVMLGLWLSGGFLITVNYTGIDNFLTKIVVEGILYIGACLYKTSIKR